MEQPLASSTRQPPNRLLLPRRSQDSSAWYPSQHAYLPLRNHRHVHHGRPPELLDLDFRSAKPLPHPGPVRQHLRFLSLHSVLQLFKTEKSYLGHGHHRQPYGAG